MRYPPVQATPRSGLYTALQWLLAVCLLGAGGWLMQEHDPAFAAGGEAVAAVPAGFLWARNLAPFALLSLTLLALSARPVFAALLTGCVGALLYHANTLKLEQLGAPVMPADLLLLINLGKRGSALLLRYLPHEAGAIATTLAVLALLAAVAWRERPLRVLRGWRQLAAAALACLACASLYRGAAPWRAWYGASDAAVSWVPAAHAREHGLPAHLLLYHWATDAALERPDRAAAAALIDAHRAQLQPRPPLAAAELPDIVILQSESLFDPARLRGLGQQSFLPRFRALAAGAQHGELMAPTYGGGTIRTEFEVLTGIAMRYFPRVQYPYFGLTATRERSIARLLRRQGYRTVVVHPYDRGFWNRAAALANLGFDLFDAEEDFGDAPRQGWYISDDALVDHVLRRLAEVDGPQLILAISMENHGPYEDYPNVDAARRDAQPVPATLDAEAAAQLRGYLYHVDNADRALGRLAAALRERPRRSVLLFYGDHLPTLPRVYEQLGFADGRPAAQQPVPWLLLDTAQATAREPLMTASFYLPGLLLDTADVAVDPYFRLLEALRAADTVDAEWVPANNDALGAIMQLRQRREFSAFLDEQLAADTPAPAAR